MKIVIIGGVAGGASAAARLRRLDEGAEIILLEKGPAISFANCGLPYYVGDEIPNEQALQVQTPADFKQRFRVDVRIWNEAVALDRTAKTVRVKDHQKNTEYTESYDKLLLAPGAAPVVPPFPGYDSQRIFTLRTIPDATSIRNRMATNVVKEAVVVGGGFIGVEMAENLSRMGIHVSVVEMADHLLPPFDPEMAAGVAKELRRNGVDLYLGRAVKGFAPEENGIRVLMDEGELSAQAVILSIGVRPDTGFLENSGIELNARGAIVTNQHMRTNDPDIYAAGDAVEVTHYVTGAKTQVPLGGPANKQGRVAADNMAGLSTQYGGSQASAIVRAFRLTAAITGINEKLARRLGLAYDKVYINAPSHATYYPGATSMVIKLLFQRENGQVLGAQIVGQDGVDKRCDVIAAAIRAKSTVIDLTDLELCYAPPFSSAKDPVNIAGYAAENILLGKVKQVYWEDYKNLPKDGSVIILDVRRPDEYARNHLPGAVHIPLEELRDRMDELDKSKPIYTHCLSGQRSYLACRILSQHGFDCYNYAGGYRLFKDMYPDQP